MSQNKQRFIHISFPVCAIYASLFIAVFCAVGKNISRSSSYAIISRISNMSNTWIYINQFHNEKLFIVLITPLLSLVKPYCLLPVLRQSSVLYSELQRGICQILLQPIRIEISKTFWSNFQEKNITVYPTMLMHPQISMTHCHRLCVKWQWLYMKTQASETSARHNMMWRAKGADHSS